MKTKIGKLLVVVTLIASLGFMGFALATSLGGPNWNAEMLTLQGTGEFQGFKFASNDTGEWTVTRGREEQPLAKSRMQAEVVVKALKAVTDEQKKLIQERQALQEQQEARLEAAKKNQAADEAALAARRDEEIQRYTQTREQASQLAIEVARKTEEAQAIEQRIGERREDVIRLQTQLAEIRTDAFRLRDLKQNLTDQLQQVLADLDRASERTEQLRTSAE